MTRTTCIVAPVRFAPDESTKIHDGAGHTMRPGWKNNRIDEIPIYRVIINGTKEILMSYKNIIIHISMLGFFINLLVNVPAAFCDDIYVKTKSGIEYVYIKDAMVIYDSIINNRPGITYYYINDNGITSIDKCYYGKENDMESCGVTTNNENKTNILDSCKKYGVTAEIEKRNGSIDTVYCVGFDVLAPKGYKKHEAYHRGERPAMPVTNISFWPITLNEGIQSMDINEIDKIMLDGAWMKIYTRDGILKEGRAVNKYLPFNYNNMPMEIQSVYPSLIGINGSSPIIDCIYKLNLLDVKRIRFLRVIDNILFNNRQERSGTLDDT